MWIAATRCWPDADLADLKRLDLLDEYDLRDVEQVAEALKHRPKVVSHRS